MSGARRFGKCNVCSQAVYGGNGTPENPGRVNNGGKRVPHHHRKPYRVVPDQPESDLYEHGWRGWMDVADRMGAL